MPGTETENVIIAVDGSSEAENAIKWYMENCHKSNHKIIVLHCIQPSYLYGLTDHYVYNDVVEEMERQGYTLKKQVTSILRKHGIRLSSKAQDPASFKMSAETNAGEWIVKTSQKEKARLVVVGPRGMGLIRRTILGNMPDYVIKHTKCAVAVVHADKTVKKVRMDIAK